MRRDLLTSVIVPVSVRVPVLVLELTVVLGHKSDLEGIDADLRILEYKEDADLLLERLDIAEVARSSLLSSSIPSSSRQYTLLKDYLVTYHWPVPDATWWWY